MRHISFLGFLNSRKCLVGVGLTFLSFYSSYSSAKADIHVELTPHRAVYDMGLEKASERSGIADISARLVYELKGSTCEGFTLNIRLLSTFTTRTNKKNTTDVRISSFEGENGTSYQYTSQQLLNQVQTRKFRGIAKREKESIIVRQDAPTKQISGLPKETLFPSQHTLKILLAAQSGKTLVSSVYFDGSDGVEVLRVSAIIGKHTVPGSATFKNEFLASKRLKTLSSWPVILSYFKHAESNSGEQTPAYEMSMHMFENGVASRMKLTYTDFSIGGELADLEFFPPAKCDE